MNLYKSLIFILYLGIFLGSGFRTPAQSRDSITLIRHIRHRAGHPPTYTTRQRGKRRSPGNPYFSSHFTSQQNPLAGRTPDRPYLYLHQESGNRSIIDSFFPWNQRFPNTGKLERDQYHTSFIGYFRFFTDPGLFYR